MMKHTQYIFFIISVAYFTYIHIDIILHFTYNIFLIVDKLMLPHSQLIIFVNNLMNLSSRKNNLIGPLVSISNLTYFFFV